jgi:hypothetical protein
MAVANPYPEIAEVAQFIADTLKTLVAPAGGDSVVVADRDELWQQASRNTQSLLIYTLFAGETPYGTNPKTTPATQRISWKWQVFVQRGINYKANRGDGIAKVTPSGPQPFLTLLGNVRTTVRGMVGISLDTGIDDLMLKPVKIGGQGDGMVAYMVEFTTKNFLQNYDSLPKTQLRKTP